MEVHAETAVPYLDSAQMAEVDRLMTEEYGIDLIQMMENAGRNLARLACRRFLEDDPRGKRVAVLAGPGGNGGGALVAARHAHNWGAAVTVCLARPVETLSPVTTHQLEILGRMHLVVTNPFDLPARGAGFDLILDGLVGYSLCGAPHGFTAELIRWANVAGIPILALDLPSGIDAGSGEVYEPAIAARATMTLALPKTGLRAEAARHYVGELYLADIGVPPELYASPTLRFPVSSPFVHGEVVRLW